MTLALYFDDGKTYSDLANKYSNLFIDFKNLNDDRIIFFNAFCQKTSHEIPFVHAVNMFEAENFEVYSTCMHTAYYTMKCPTVSKHRMIVCNEFWNHKDFDQYQTEPFKELSFIAMNTDLAKSVSDYFKTENVEIYNENIWKEKTEEEI